MKAGAATTDVVAQLATLFLLVTGATLILLVVGAALFYGGLGGRRGAARTLGLTTLTIGVVVLVWIGYGYGTAFGPPLIPHGLGNPLSHPWLSGLPEYGLAFAGFQALVAAFTVVLILGSQQGRVRPGPWIAFVVLWMSLVYLPVAYGIFNDLDGWGGALLEVNDFAGGIAVQVNAGGAALAVTLVLASRRPALPMPRRTPAAAGGEVGDHGTGSPDDAVAVHHSGPSYHAAVTHPTIRIGSSLTVVGVALLWFGWLGLDTGSEAAVDTIAALAWINTLVAPAAGLIAWLVVQAIRETKPTLTGAAFGAIAGLAAVSPACNSIAPGWAIVLGATAAVPCALVLEWDAAKRICGIALPVVGINLVAGLIGTLFVGLFGAGIGLVDAGNFDQLAVQGLAAFAVLAYSFGVTWLIAFVLDRTVGLGDGERRAGSRSGARKRSVPPAERLSERAVEQGHG